MSQGKIFKKLVRDCAPVQVVGTINAYTALMAEKIGHQAIYLSGGGVANASYGLPDLGITSLDNVLEDVRRITHASNLPLLVDIDTGWGSAFNIALTIKKMEKEGVAAVHIEDQVSQKRCGHRPNKELVSLAEMALRIKIAVEARQDDDFVIMARTDALSVEGLERAIERAMAYVEAGADMIFPEAMTKLEHYQQFCQAVKVPCLANITEFGQTPLFTKQELHSVGIQLVLYPLSAFRAMNRAAENVYTQLLLDGHQHGVIDTMQTRAELYEYLNYHRYEQTLDNLNNKEKRQ